LPRGTPGWDVLLGYTLEQISKEAQRGNKGFKTIWKLLRDARFLK